MHEWWGLNDYARSRAKQLAELGYTALAVDMFGEGKVADHPKDAGAFSGLSHEGSPGGHGTFSSSHAGAEIAADRGP